MWNYHAHDILILGDSFAESYCVQNTLQENFSSNLKLVSLGKGGNGPLTSVASFIEYNIKFNAKTVYFLVVPNDYSRPIGHKLNIDLERELSEPILRRYLTDYRFNYNYFNGLDLSAYRNFAIHYSKGLFNTLHENEIRKETIIRKVSHLFLYDFFRKILINSIEQDTAEIRFIDNSRLKNVYRRSITEANLHDSRLVFIPLPDKQYSCKEDPRQTFITQVLKDINANVLNVWHELCNINFFAVNGRHFNVQGYGVYPT